MTSREIPRIIAAIALTSHHIISSQHTLSVGVAIEMLIFYFCAGKVLL
jgi:hypothetical protein